MWKECLLKRRKVTQVNKEETGGAAPHIDTNQSTCIGKCSVTVRGVAPKSFDAVFVVGGLCRKTDSTLVAKND